MSCDLTCLQVTWINMYVVKLGHIIDIKSFYQWNWAVSHLAERRELRGPVQNERPSRAERSKNEGFILAVYYCRVTFL